MKEAKLHQHTRLCWKLTPIDWSENDHERVKNVYEIIDNDDLDRDQEITEEHQWSDDENCRCQRLAGDETTCVEPSTSKV